jgi:hypothetical protein
MQHSALLPEIMRSSSYVESINAGRCFWRENAAAAVRNPARHCASHNNKHVREPQAMRR